MQSLTQQGSQSLRISRKYVKVGVIVYFVIVPVVSSIAISHVWAVGNTDVTFFLPYISDSGGDPPQSAVFGLGLTAAAIAAIVTFSLRYVTVMDISKAKNMPGYVLLLNYFNFVAGIGIFFGLILVAMNPTGHLRRDGTWLSPIFVPHVLGASVLFASGLVYMLVNALLTLCLVDQYRNYGVLKARVVIFAFDLVACALTAVKFPKNLLSMKPHPTSPREYPEGTIISIIAEWFMLATFMGYFYAMKSELDAMVVVIGIQKRRSLLGTDDSERGTAPPQFLSASIRKDPGVRNPPQQLDGTAGQRGLLGAATLNASTHSSNGRSLSSLPLAVHSVPRPVENPTIQLQNPLERSRSTGHPSPPRVSRKDLERAAGVITPLGGKETGESRQSCLPSTHITAFTNTGASGYPTSNGRHQAVVPADPSNSGVEKAKSPPSEETSEHRKEVSVKRSNNEDRSATHSSRRSKSRGEVSSRSSSRHTRGPPLPRGRPIAARH